MRKADPGGMQKTKRFDDSEQFSALRYLDYYDFKSPKNVGAIGDRPLEIQISAGFNLGTRATAGRPYGGWIPAGIEYFTCRADNRSFVICIPPHPWRSVIGDRPW